jgi:hypothetical protein
VCELISGESLTVKLSGNFVTISLHVAGTVVLHVTTKASACVGTKLWFPPGQAGAIKTDARQPLD